MDMGKFNIVGGLLREIQIYRATVLDHEKLNAAVKLIVKQYL